MTSDLDRDALARRELADQVKAAVLEGVNDIEAWNKHFFATAIAAVVLGSDLRAPFAGESRHRCLTDDEGWVACPPDLCEADRLVSEPQTGTLNLDKYVVVERDCLELVERLLTEAREGFDDAHKWSDVWTEIMGDGQRALNELDAEVREMLGL